MILSLSVSSKSILYDKNYLRKTGRFVRVNLVILMIMMTVMTRMIMIFS